MFPIYERKAFASERNGTIVVRTILGVRKVLVGEFEQSSLYMAALWGSAMRRVAREQSVKRVLVLGLGAGSSIRGIHRRFPNANVTAIEWDPAMVELAKSLKLFPADQTPEIIVGDALEAIRTLDRKYDLILVDLFTGGIPDPRLSSEETVRALSSLLEPDGSLVLNLYQSREPVGAFAHALSCHARWRFLFNELALFRPRGNGKVGDPLPVRFRHCQQSRRYLVGGFRKGDTTFTAVGTETAPGMRWHVGPFWFESYVGDAEPVVETGGHRRLVMWQPLTRRDTPPGWRRSWLQFNSRQNGVTEITDPSNYWKSWSTNAQRHRKKFLRDLPYDIREVGFDEFVAGFHATGKLGWIRNDFVNVLKRRIEGHGQDCRMLGAVDRTTGRVMAGLAVVDLPDISQSVHLIAYNHPDAEETSVGHALIDRWFQDCIAKGIRFLNFALVWAPGDPKAWKGYSRFKRQFAPFLIRYPYPLVRIAK